GGEIEDVAVAARREHDGISRVALDFASDEITDDNALRVPSDHNEVEHLAVRVHLDQALADRARECEVGAKQELLAGLAARVERATYLRAAERTVGKQ